MPDAVSGTTGTTYTPACLHDGGAQGPGEPEGHVPEAPGRPDEVPGPGQPGEQQRVHGADGDLHPGGEARGDRRAERLAPGPAARPAAPAPSSAAPSATPTRPVPRRPALVTSVRLGSATTEASAMVGGVSVSDGPHHRGRQHRRPRPEPVLTSIRTPTDSPPPGDPTPEELLPMLRSMFSAISGLRAHQTKMDVTGNNIANVNTVGFKGSQTVFQDTLSQVIRAGGAPAADRGGTNPAQVGLGVKVAATTTNWTQGATQSTGRSTDFMIEGDGFFVTARRQPSSSTPAPGRSTSTARASWSPRTAAILQGWMADAAGVVNPNGPIGDLSVPYGQIVNPKQLDDRQRSSATCPPTAATGTSCRPASRCTTARASSRRSSTTSRRPRRPTPGTLDITHANGTALVTGATVAFNACRRAHHPGRAGHAAPFTPPVASFPELDRPRHRRRRRADPVRRRQHRRARRTRTATASARCSPSSSATTARSWASTPTAPPAAGPARPGLVQQPERPGEGRQLHVPGRRRTPAWPRSGRPVSAAAASLISGALEMSNVDLAEEFTGLIVAQRGFQANSRVITAPTRSCRTWST